MGGSGYVKSKSIRIATTGNNANTGRQRRRGHSEYIKSPSPMTYSFPTVVVASSLTTPTSTTQTQAARMSPPSKPFYAGAKFETHPSCTALPPPPVHWTTPNNRSQSQPSSPTNNTTVVNSNNTLTKSSNTASSNPTTRFTPIDLMALFASASAAASSSTTRATAVAVVNKSPISPAVH